MNKNWLLLPLLLSPASLVTADELPIAVASNFVAPMRAIIQRFEESSPHKVLPVFGSTGKQYAQIINGAPFALFFAADEERPRMLEEQGVAISGSRFTYAVGRLVLWSPQDKFIDKNGDVLGHGTFRYLAIANPVLAPYGKAAQQVLQSRGLWKELQSKMVRGENIAQTFQFVKSGNAQLGFVSSSQVKQSDQPPIGSWWEIPAELYTPIRQQVVLLKDDSIAREFLAFVKSDEVKQMISDFGYGLP